jgi:hypothetical protein
LSNLDDYISMKKLYDEWEETFGKKELFESRLNSSNFCMWWIVPYSIIETKEWRKDVYDELIRIQYGVVC